MRGLVVVAAGLAWLLLGCTPAHDSSARSVCHRHFAGTTVAVEMTIRDARFAGGPRPADGDRGPSAGYADDDRVARCLVPTGADSADVIDVVERDGKTFIRWHQQGNDATKRLMPPT